MPRSTYRRHAASATAGIPTEPQGGMTVMDITIHVTFLPHDDPDAFLAFLSRHPRL
jgi:hypothetical protein